MHPLNGVLRDTSLLRYFIIYRRRLRAGLAARIPRCWRGGRGAGSPTDTGTLTPGAHITQPLAITVFRNSKQKALHPE